ncbi:hypothetical protein [Gordonia aichiensis]|uniref:hypothetical protein n=1 Tax=Gordonia aichiensis TaxID=36820 RepID=UPI0014615394
MPVHQVADQERAGLPAAQTHQPEDTEQSTVEVAAGSVEDGPELFGRVRGTFLMGERDDDALGGVGLVDELVADTSLDRSPQHLHALLAGLCADARSGGPDLDFGGVERGRTSSPTAERSRALTTRSGDWNTGHSRDELLTCLDEGLCCCATCLSPEALGGWTPLIMDEDR